MKVALRGGDLAFQLLTALYDHDIVLADFRIVFDLNLLHFAIDFGPHVLANFWTKMAFALEFELGGIKAEKRQSAYKQRDYGKRFRKRATAEELGAFT